jgi:hypothetical protein
MLRIERINNEFRYNMKFNSDIHTIIDDMFNNRSKCILYLKYPNKLIRVLAKFLVLYDISSYNEIVVNDIVKTFKIQYLIYAFGKIDKVDGFEFDEEKENV